MQRIECDNKLQLDVYVNGVPDLSAVPQDRLDVFIAVLLNCICDNCIDHTDR